MFRPRRSFTYEYWPQLPFGKAYFAVIDVEAVIIHPMKGGAPVNVVEQVAIVLIDNWGREVLGEKHMVYQPMDNLQLAAAYGATLADVKKSSEAYNRITGDGFIHKDVRRYERWSNVRKRVMKLCRDHALLVYAKGIALETAVFYGELEFQDLAWTGCPRYPLALHDPLQECRFFAQYIPETMVQPFYIF